MRFQVLLSCMNANDFSIIGKSNLMQVPCLVINQCATEKEYFTETELHTMCNSPSRGLSISRNLAIQYSNAEYCLFSDDDEQFCDGLEEKIISAYESLSDADIIIFKMSNYPTKLGNKIKKLKKYELLRVSSWQISFKMTSVKNKYLFDPKLGAGTGNGASEENKFLFDCYKDGLKIYYVPIEIASVAQEQSTWRSARDEKYFFNRGKTTRYILGQSMATIYALYFLITKHKLYKKDISFLRAMKYLFKGIATKSIDEKLT